MRPLLVGEAPARTTEGMPPFSGRSGRFVLALAGLQRLEDGFDAVNLLDRWPGRSSKGSAFPIEEARERAACLAAEQPPGRVLVCAGRRVWRAFRLPTAAPYMAEEERDGRRFALLPHPSGVNRWWNDPLARERASAFLRGVVA